MKTVIIDYGMGNLRSVQKAVEYIGRAAEISGDFAVIESADCFILPGVGAFCDAIARLTETGLKDVIVRKVRENTPLLGICLGMQLLYEKSYEDGEYTGLGLLEGEVRRFTGKEKIPHMGWNTLTPVKNVLTKGLDNPAQVYFVHSYYAPVTADTDAYCEYAGAKFSASVNKGNLYATQFHPEKSGEAGLKILENFFMGAEKR